MNKNEKQQAVSELKAKIDKASSIYLTDFTGLTVAETNELRDKFHNARIDYKVVKNTLFQKALADGGNAKFSELTKVVTEKLEGPTGIIFAYDDPVIPAKILTKFSEKTEKPKLKLAIVESVLYDSSKLKTLAAIPSKPEIISSIIACLNSPVAGIVNCVIAVIRELASVIEEVAKKKNQ